MLVTPPAAYAQGFHTKAFVWKGIYVLGNNQMEDEAVLRAAEIVFNSLSTVNVGLIAELAKYDTRFAVIPFGTDITDLPDYDDLGPSWSAYRGLGGVIGRPTSSSGEENLIPTHADDPYFHMESIGLHEWLHAVEGIGLAKWNPTLHGQFMDAYENAKDNGLWANTYADDTFFEYFAETGQVFFNNNPDLATPNGIHNTINTRAELQTYDPTVYNLFIKLFGNSGWTVGEFYGSENADNLIGRKASELIFGNGGDDFVHGNDGDDNLFGGTGMDTVTGGAGKDLLDAGTQNDTLRIFTGHVAAGEIYDGGTGIDTLFLASHATTAATYSIDLRSVTLRLIDAITLQDPGENNSATVKLNAAQIGATALSGTSVVTGTSFADVADRFEVTMGTKSTVNLSAFTFVDFAGAKDRVVVIGDTTAETIVGSKMADSLSGGDGNDKLGGGLGRDTLNGGTGADKFSFNTALSAANIDIITSFAHNSDLIQLDDAIFKNIGATLDPGEFYKAAGAVAGHDISDRIIYNTSNGRLYIDPDGNKVSGGVAAIHFATLTNKPATLDAGDFIIV